MAALSYPFDSSFPGISRFLPLQNLFNSSLTTNSSDLIDHDSLLWPPLSSVLSEGTDGSGEQTTDSDDLTDLSVHMESTAATTWINVWENVVVNYSDPSVFWTVEELKLLGLVPWQLHYVLGCIVALIGLLGMTGNGLILLISTRFRRLRSPANIFIINLALSDFCASMLHPMAAYSSFNGRWAFGKQGCELYGLGIGFFGLNSIVTLAAIACERYVVITSKPFGGSWRITRRRARKVCVIIWIYCVALVVPPLWGISAYIPEGLRTTCSWDYSTRTLSNRLYYFYLLFFGFLLPVTIITFCYGVIFKAVLLHSKEMTHIAVSSQKTFTRKARRKTDIRTAQIIITLVILFLIAWTPYAIVSLVGQFGSGKLTNPLATTIPAFFAKTSIVVNPLVYGYSHPQFRSSVKEYLGNLSSSMPFFANPTTPKLSHATLRRKPSEQKFISSKQVSPLADRKVRAYSESSGYPYPSYSSYRGGSIARAVHPLPRHSFPRLFGSNMSEPDLMRCSDRIIPGAASMSYVEYRRKKRGFIQKMFFRSETLLEVCKMSEAYSSKPARKKGYQGNRALRRKNHCGSGNTFSSSYDSLHVLNMDAAFYNKGRKQSVLSSHGRLSSVNRKMFASWKNSTTSYASVLQSFKKCPFSAKSAQERRQTITMLSEVVFPLTVGPRRTSSGTLIWRTRGCSVASTLPSRSLLMSSLTCTASATLPRNSRPFPRSHANCCECAQTITLASVPEGPGRSRLEFCLDDSPRSSIF